MQRKLARVHELLLAPGMSEQRFWREESAQCRGMVEGRSTG
jgi:hypothetical protein